MNQSKIAGIAWGLTAVTIYAGWMAVTRHSARTALDPWDLAFLRFGFAGLVLAPVVWRQGLGLDKLGWRGLAFLVATAGAPYTVVAATGMGYAPAAHAAALIPGVIPLFVALQGQLFLRLRYEQGQWLGLAAIAAGALAIGGFGAILGAPELWRGHALFLLAANMWSAYTLYLGRIGLTALHATAIVSVGSFLVYVPPYLAIAGWRVIEAPPDDIILQTLYQGLLVSIVALIAFNRAIALLGPKGASLLAFVPVFTVILAIPALGEWPSAVDVVGIALVSLGVYVVGVRAAAARS
ncbi:MAG: DMT family transporter [Alphaproteobacteria bacterium]|nr:DMT family transporter [Alphaproteobacteria bacterium]